MRHREVRGGQPLTGGLRTRARIVLSRPRTTLYPRHPMTAATALPRPFAARRRRTAVVGVFAVQFVVLGLWLEGTRTYVSEPKLVLSAVQSALLWGLIALPSERSRLWRALAAAAVAPVLVLQTLFHARYGTFIDAEVVRSTFRFWADVKPELTAFAPRIGLLSLGVAIVEFTWLSLACKRAPGSP